RSAHEDIALSQPKGSHRDRAPASPTLLIAGCFLASSSLPSVDPFERDRLFISRRHAAEVPCDLAFETRSVAARGSLDLVRSRCGVSGDESRLLESGHRARGQLL